MLKQSSLMFCVLLAILLAQPTKANITLNELIFDESKPFHLKILEGIPPEGKIEYGPKDAKNTIIEFMDYFCGYCKKIHPELIEIVNERDDVRVIFLQHPILSEASLMISKLVIAASFQNKGFELHHAVFSITGSINKKKLENAITESGINRTKLKIDSGRPEIAKILKLSSFLANGIGSRGTPAIYINEKFFGGYIEKNEIIKLLKK